jgi:hypothetical protein
MSIAHEHRPSKSSSLTTVCVQSPVNSFRAILHAVQRSHEISRACARKRESRGAYKGSGIVLCCTAWKEAVVYHYFAA